MKKKDIINPTGDMDAPASADNDEADDEIFSEDYIPCGIGGDYGVPDLENFFKRDWRFTKFSPYEILYLSITDPASERRINRFMMPGSKEARAEYRMIKQAADPGVLIEMMKTCSGISSRHRIARMLASSDAGMKILLNELRSENSDPFFWTAAKAVSLSGGDYSAELIDAVENGCMRAYPVSVLCVALGFIDNTEALNCVWRHFRLFKDFFPEKNYHEGPLFGLVAAYNRGKKYRKKLAI